MLGEHTPIEPSPGIHRPGCWPVSLPTTPSDHPDPPGRHELVLNYSTEAPAAFRSSGMLSRVLWNTGIFEIKKGNSILTSKPNRDQLLKTVVAIADVLRDAPFQWHVCGGVAVCLLTGIFSRWNSDVDLVFEATDAATVLEFLSSRGLTPLIKVSSVKVYPERYVRSFRKAQVDDLGLDRVAKVLTGDPEMSSVVDLFFCRREAEGTRFVWEGINILAQGSITAPQVVRVNNRQIPILAPEIVARLKNLPGVPKHQHDLRLLEDLAS